MMKTKQETFNQAYLGLKSQKFEKSEVVCQGIDEGLKKCAYRGEGGLKCAAGHLIPDEKFGPDMVAHYNNSSSTTPRIAEILHDEGHDIPFVEDLQGVHDNSSSPREMDSRLRMLAKTSRLEIPEG